MPRLVSVDTQILDTVNARIQDISRTHHLSPRRIHTLLQRFTLTEIELGKWENNQFIPCSGYLSKRNIGFYCYFLSSKK